MYYSPGHLFLIFFAFLILGILGLVFRGRKRAIDKVFNTLSILILAADIALVSYSVATGIYNWEWYLPVHICNFFTVILPLGASSPAPGPSSWIIMCSRDSLDFRWP